MANKNIYPNGKMKRVNFNINPDYEKEILTKVKEVIKPYRLLKNETESEYIQRIQQMHLDNCADECLKIK